MQTRDWVSPLPPAVLLLPLLSLPACTSQTVSLINPHSGATVECSASSFGLAMAFLQGYIDDCIRRGETRGYVPVDKLTPEERVELENRGLLPKSSGTAEPRP
jgi:hypothetical protein